MQKLVFCHSVNNIDRSKSDLHFCCSLLKQQNNSIPKARVFFIFRFTDPPDPIFLEIEKKIKEIFFQFYFFISLRLMPVQYWSSVMFFGFVFSIAARLIKLPPVTAPGEILPF